MPINRHLGLTKVLQPCMHLMFPWLWPILPSRVSFVGSKQTTDHGGNGPAHPINLVVVLFATWLMHFRILSDSPILLFGAVINNAYNAEWRRVY